MDKNRYQALVRENRINKKYTGSIGLFVSDTSWYKRILVGLTGSPRTQWCKIRTKRTIIIVYVQTSSQETLHFFNLPTGRPLWEVRRLGEESDRAGGRGDVTEGRASLRQAAVPGAEPEDQHPQRVLGEHTGAAGEESTECCAALRAISCFTASDTLLQKRWFDVSQNSSLFDLTFEIWMEYGVQ